MSSENSQPKYGRRTLLRTVGTVSSITLLSTNSIAQSENSEVVAPEESEVLIKEENYIIRKITVSGTVFATKVYTGGPMEGKVKQVKVGEDDSVVFSEEGVSVQDASIEVVTASEEVEKSGNEVIKRSKNLGGSIGFSCDANYCEDGTYAHKYGGVTFELTELANGIGHAVLAGAIGGLLATYTVYKASAGIVGLLSDTLINMNTGKTYTFIPIDVDRKQWWGAGDLKPKVKNKIGQGWDLDRWQVSTFHTGDKHLGHFTGGCQ